MRSFPLGRAFGIPLFIHWTCLFLPLWPFFASGGGSLGVALGLAGLVSMFTCVLLHELGHALMARAFGIPTRDITLYAIGGVARLESTGHSPHQEVCIALAGPAVNLVLLLLFLPAVIGLFLLGARPLGPEGAVAGVEPLALLLTYLALLCAGNGALMLFNLLPAFPMDGGRVLRALLTLPLGLLRATEVAAALGAVLALGMVLLAVMRVLPPMLALVGFFVLFAGQAELFGMRRLEAARLRRLAVPGEVPVEAVPVEPLVRLGDPLDPTVPMRPVGVAVAQAGGFTGYLWDTEQKVWVYWVDGHPCGEF